jgi:SAM-dependent methyltransferase
MLFAGGGSIPAFGSLQKGSIMPSLSFDPMVHSYDVTRTYDEASFSAAVAYLVERFPPRSFPRLLEPGIGTGRIALPLAERGYVVWGVDIASQMLAVLQQRMAHAAPRVCLTVSQADVCALPFHMDVFDLVIAVHLFYFIPTWQQAVQELLRVVRVGRPLVLMHTGMGKEIPALNERYKALCAAAGFPLQAVGVQSTSEVVAYCHTLGCRMEAIRDRWQWSSQTRLDEAMAYIRARAYSFTTMVPPRVHTEAVRRLEEEVREHYGSLTYAVEVPDQIAMVLVWKP